MKHQANQQFITRRDLADRWLVSTETLKRKERAGLLRAFKIGRGVRYRMADVLAFEEGAAV
jgi:hypothetical protein